MKMIDLSNKSSVKAIALYLTKNEAIQFRDELDSLLKNPEAIEHFHIYENDMSRELSCSIITEKKLQDIKQYNKLEQKILLEK